MVSSGNQEIFPGRHLRTEGWRVGIGQRQGTRSRGRDYSKQRKQHLQDQEDKKALHNEGKAVVHYDERGKCETRGVQRPSMIYQRVIWNLSWK